MAKHPLPNLKPGTLVTANVKMYGLEGHGYLWIIVEQATETRWTMGEDGKPEQVNCFVEAHREDDRDAPTWLYKCKSLATGREQMIYCEDIELQGATNNVR